ncbi:ATP-binding protein [Pseudomonas guariconensis]|uniref:ATP-binding protein n=1 Tax=Pseudomonas guariconensis TaxID=1288410 RepID=UPI0015E09E84|nr:ATP-binding protein [Pseudomonas guariconensis]
MDYARIRGKDSGKHLAFEELVCQLARREPQDAGAEFRRVHGSGGDGGIEAYWVLPGGAEIGYQAKYYLKSSEINWANLDGSVRQALKTHPNLTGYVVALPCDLTDRTGKQGTGNTGWEHWNARKAKWEALVPEGRKVQFVPWTAFELSDRLTHRSAEGLRRYWFGDVEFSELWFAKNLEVAIKSLEERYHSDDHVEVASERLFSVKLRSLSVIHELQAILGAILGASDLGKVLDKFGEALGDSIDSIERNVIKILEATRHFNSDAWCAWPVSETLLLVERTLKLIGRLQIDILQLTQPKPTRDERLELLETAVKSLRSFLKRREVIADEKQSILLYGKAGSGKSHLLGRVAEKAIQEGTPAILILGQQLTRDDLWHQIMRRVGVLDATPDVFLQALSASAEASKRRGLILIDAINEGPGPKLWRNELAGFIARVEKFPNLVLVFSCRTEYRSYVVPEPVEQLVATVMVRGFVTAQEQARAARMYLGKRGISQPDTPWLAAEFVNPLFLRSACIALNRANQKWFPKGLVGTRKVFSYYLDNIARSLGAGRDGSEDLVKPTFNTLMAVARGMAEGRSDYVERCLATKIAAERFSAFPPPSELSWFDVLVRNGLFRLDPHPDLSSDDPDSFDTLDEVVRFSFQRLQDYLMAASLLTTVEDPVLALKDGVLSFVHDEEGLGWEWNGLTQALSVQIPERFGLEFIDALPGEMDIWINDEPTRDGFIESLRWRSNEAFTDRTREVYEMFLDFDEDYFDLLIQVSASAGHPWNALALHESLSKLSMPQRDAVWTRKVNSLDTDEGSVTQRLINWCAFEQNEHISSDVQYLCALTMAWLTASTYREIRDKATKALASLMRHNIKLYGDLCEAFSGVDDLYIQERIHAAAYGSCCLDPEKRRLNLYSRISFDVVFNRENVPASILLRDSAFGIIQLAIYHGALGDDINIDLATPPYRSAAIHLSISEAELKAVSKKAGGSEIRSSCGEWGGDFGDYEVRPRVSSFIDVLLSAPEPSTNAERYNSFEEQVIGCSAERAKLLKLMRDAKPNPFRDLRLRRSQQEIEEAAEDFKDLELLLLSDLTQAETQRYYDEFKSSFESSSDEPDRLPYIDVPSAQRWIAKRAYDYGWTAKLFPNDRSYHHNHGRERPAGERIGKKYQWLALDELLCSLADNYWMAEKGQHGSRQYAGPLDIGFHRDIDPTILLSEDAIRDFDEGLEHHEINLQSIAEHEIGKWPFLSDPSELMPKLISRSNPAGQRWAVLHEHRSVSDRYEDDTRRQHGLRIQEWRFLLPVLVRREDSQSLRYSIMKQESIRVDEWSTRKATDDGYLLEAPWRSTWSQERWETQHFSDSDEIEVAFPCFRYHWESHLDASMPDGAHALLPAPWLSHRLGLKPLADHRNAYVDDAGVVRFLSGTSPSDGSYAFIDQELFQSFLDEDELDCIWVFVAERSAWPGGENEHASRRRSDGVIWVEQGQAQMTPRTDDWARGESEKYLAVPPRAKRRKPRR